MNTTMPAELRALRELFQTCDPVPEHALDAAYAAGRLVASGNAPATGELELVSDSADSPALVRVGAAGRDTRVLTYVMPGRVLELDLVPTVPGMLRASGIVISRAGQKVPTGAVALRHPDGQRSGALDGHGAFRVDDVPAGPLSVSLLPNGSTPVIADWLVC